jgi:excisionase family DNA binding protein
MPVTSDIKGEPVTDTARQPDAGADPLLTPAEVAALFRVDPKTVTRWAKSGKLKTATKTLGGQRRYRESEVRALLRGDTGLAGPS